ncbi:MAG: selenide, water dikinase SelD [Cyclobacteriaceae bacterium]|nr:selenide, water dikinase SelD [Cyclobacteriaceae bacterium]MCX7636647.1 selenide, water dikinase SelD [Cyclobacteriaceae bacterium]
MTTVNLTEYAHGAGCGCKIAPATLENILKQTPQHTVFSGLMVGNETRDDAAVFALDDKNCIISTTDFFMPIVDDAFTFGAIAAANALSDIYAMGGKPLLALAVLGWPVDKLPAAVASQVLEGARKVCEEAGIPLAGGHSIDCVEPFFGLAATGMVKRENLKRNNTAQPGDLIYLTKPLGSGILTTAAKRKQVEEADLQEAIRWMTQLNSIGEKLGELPYVTALTDVTGFGLLGHLLEVCEGSNTSADIFYDRVPLMNNLTQYTSRMIYPDNTMRNWQSYEKKVSGIGTESLLTLCDPQTNGGLLVCVQNNSQKIFERMMIDQNLTAYSIGSMNENRENVIRILNG